MTVTLLSKICFALVIAIGIIELIVYYAMFTESEGQVDLTNTTCTESVYIGRKLFFHKCMKENKTVYDLRYFWKDKEADGALKANIIGVQMITDEFNKICKFCQNM